MVSSSVVSTMSQMNTCPESREVTSGIVASHCLLVSQRLYFLWILLFLLSMSRRKTVLSLVPAKHPLLQPGLIANLKGVTVTGAPAFIGQAVFISRLYDPPGWESADNARQWPEVLTPSADFSKEGRWENLRIKTVVRKKKRGHGNWIWILWRGEKVSKEPVYLYSSQCQLKRDKNAQLPCLYFWKRLGVYLPPKVGALLRLCLLLLLPVVVVV